MTVVEAPIVVFSIITFFAVVGFVPLMALFFDTSFYLKVFYSKYQHARIVCPNRIELTYRFGRTVCFDKRQRNWYFRKGLSKLEDSFSDNLDVLYKFLEEKAKNDGKVKWEYKHLIE